jgi:hypothetical protein
MYLNLSLTAYRQAMAAISCTKLEVSGFGLIYTTLHGEPFRMRPFRRIPQPTDNIDIEFQVPFVWLLDHGTMVETQIDPVITARFLADRMEENISPEQIKLWWHRHPMTRGWSATDEAAISMTPMGSPDPVSVGWMVSMVYTTATGWNARYDQFSPRFTIDIPVLVEGEEQNVEAEMQGVFYNITTQPKKQTTFWRDMPEPETEKQIDWSEVGYQAAEHWWDAAAETNWGIDPDRAKQFADAVYFGAFEIIEDNGIDTDKLRRMIETEAARYNVNEELAVSTAFDAWSFEYA